MPNRDFSIAGYRYGYQGQEKDDELKGKGNSINFNFRTYDSRLGRFFGVDPLAKCFAWNSPYSFSENRVIDAIELEGGEKLKVAVSCEPTPEKAGSASITISLDYQIVTTGPGAVSTSNISPTKVNQLYTSGNTTFFMKSLPTASSEGTFLDGKYARWARKAEGGNTKCQAKLKEAGIQYYKVDVTYDYTFTKGTTLEEAACWMSEDPAGRGIVMTPVNSADLKSMPELPVLGVLGDLSGGSRMANEEFKSSDVGAMGLSEKLGSTNNIVFCNPTHFASGAKYSFGLSANEVITHEAGHNAAAVNIHGTGNYEYNQEGLQSNQPGSVYPTQQNTKAIINDNANRQTIEK